MTFEIVISIYYCIIYISNERKYKFEVMAFKSVMFYVGHIVHWMQNKWIV